MGIEEQELQRILTEQLHLTENHPDMAIFDYQADFEISEYEDIYELNQAVAQLKQLPEQDYEKVMDYCDARDITSPLEISNVCLQADEVPYERFPDWIDENVKDPEEKLGYALFENNSLAPEIKAGSKTGKATITIKLASGLTKQIKVSVQKKAVTCSKIKNVPKTIKLKKKQTYQLKPMIEPITCTDKAKYKSSNKKTAKVTKSGKLTAVKKGKTKVMVVVGKKKFVCTVNIR